MRWVGLILCVLLIAAFQHEDRLRHWWRHATGTKPVAMVGSGNVVIYTFDGCGNACDDAVQFFADAGLQHSEQNVSRDPAAKASYEAYHLSGLPFIVDGPRVMRGYDQQLLQQWYLERPDNARQLAAFGLTGHQAIIFGTSWCEYCQQAQAYFKAHDVDYIEFDIEHSPEADAQEKALFDGNPLPGIVYGDMALSGYSAQRLDVVTQWTSDMGKQ